MNVMIVQPMAGIPDEEILRVCDKAAKILNEKGYIVIDTFFTKDWNDEENLQNVNKPLFYLGKSLNMMAACDAVYFCKGWESKRGCKIEHEAAKAYGLEIIYED